MAEDYREGENMPLSTSNIYGTGGLVASPGSCRIIAARSTELAEWEARNACVVVDVSGRSVAMTEHAVVIAGGGPTGLMLAGELGLAGVGAGGGWGWGGGGGGRARGAGARARGASPRAPGGCPTGGAARLVPGGGGGRGGPGRPRGSGGTAAPPPPATTTGSRYGRAT